MSKTKRNSGFTIVELLVVMVVIGILATLVVTTFRGIQQKGRNSERQTDVNALHGYLEAYYSQHTKYPTLSEINNPSFRSANLKGLDSSVFQDPTGSAQTLVASPTANFYAYDVKADNNTSCDNVSKDCMKYTLTSTNEGSPSNYVKTNLN